MPDGLNKVMLIGNLGTDPEMRYTANGSAVTTFRIAVSRSYMTEGERRRSTEWFNVVAWGSTAELVGQHVQMGQKVFVSGRLSTRTWEDDKGQKQYRTEVVTNQVLPLDRGNAVPPDEPDDQPDADQSGDSEGLNEMIVMGNLGRDPEMRYTASGSAVTTFSVAVNRSFSADGQRREETEWIRVVAWNKLAELVSQYLTKGRRAFVEGRLTTRSWDGQDGQKHYMTEVVANQVVFLDRPQGVGLPDVPGDIDPDDLPFEG